MDEKLSKIFIKMPPIETHLSEDLYREFVKVLFDDISSLNNPDDFIEPYIYPVENIQKIAESNNIEYKESIRSMADDLWDKEDWLNSVMVFYILMHIITFLPTDFYKMGYSFAKLGHKELGEKFVNIYEPLSRNKKITCHAIGNFYYTAMELPYKALPFLEKYTEFDPDNPLVWLTLGHCCSDVGDELSKEKQLNAYSKAYELNPNDATIVKSLLTYYEKEHNDAKVKELYPKLIELAPSPRHYLNYGLYLMSWGNIYEGCSFFRERFELENYPVGYPKSILGGGTRWNCQDNISDKTLLIHFEEGFGDSIMYGRFIPLIKQYAKQTVVIVQPQLEKLFKNSKIVSEGVEIMTDIKEFISKYKNEKYVHIPMLDLPYPLGIDSHFIPFDEAYLTPLQPKIYNTNKLKVGIAYSGDISANYNIRNIELSEFEPLTRNENIQLYSLQVGEPSEQLKEYGDKIIDLGKEFNDFIDTANAIAGLDLVITVDNVILNLAGALGKKTYGLYNKYPNFRWFNLKGENVVWYKSVKPFQCKKENEWSDVIKEVEECLKKDFLNG